MIRSQSGTRLLKTFALLALLSLLATMLPACGDEDDADNGGQSSDQLTATVPDAATATATTASPPTATAQDSPTQPPSSEPTVTPGTSPAPPIPTTTPDRINHPTGVDQTVLHIETVGGFAPQSHLLIGLPLFILDGAGCYVMQGPRIEIFPQPALPNLLETCLQEEGVQYILAAAEEAGLLQGDAHYPMDMMADATTTVFTINADGRTIRVSAYALAEGSDEYITGKDAEEQKAARAKLIAFLVQVVDLESWLPPNVFVSIEQPYDIERLQLITERDDAPTSSQSGRVLAQQGFEWPLAVDLAEFGEEYLFGGYRCGVIEGEELATLLPELVQTNQLTLWTSGGLSYMLYPRPLLAGEEGCAAE